jgi:toxin CptA
MSSARFAVPFRVVLKGSFLLAAALLFIHGGALYWLFLFAVPLWVKLITAITIIASLLLQLRCHLLQKGSRAVTGLLWDGGEEWQLQMAQGEAINGRLLGSSFVSPWLIVLNFKIESNRRMLPVIVMTDTIDSTSFRRLTSKLRRVSSKAEEPVV